MIWRKPVDGIHESGYFRIYRMIKYYEVWFSHQRSFALLGKTETLRGAKAIAMEWAREHAL